MSRLSDLSKVLLDHSKAAVPARGCKGALIPSITSPYGRFSNHGIVSLQRYSSVSSERGSKQDYRFWTEAELLQLNSLVAKHLLEKSENNVTKRDWEKVAAELNSGRTAAACKAKFNKSLLKTAELILQITLIKK